VSPVSPGHEADGDHGSSASATHSVICHQQRCADTGRRAILLSLVGTPNAWTGVLPAHSAASTERRCARSADQLRSVLSSIGASVKRSPVRIRPAPLVRTPRASYFG